MAAFAEAERASGLKFWHECGLLTVGGAAGDAAAAAAEGAEVIASLGRVAHRFPSLGAAALEPLAGRGAEALLMEKVAG